MSALRVATAAAVVVLLAAAPAHAERVSSSLWPDQAVASSAAPAAAANRQVRVPAYFFKGSASGSGEYSLKVRVHDGPGRSKSRGRAEADLRWSFEVKFTPSTRYDRELRFFGRPLRTKRLERAYLPSTWRSYEALISGTQTITGWLDDVDPWEGASYGRAEFSCAIAIPGVAQSSLIGLERGSGSGWRMFFQPFQSFSIDFGELDGCVVTSPVPGRADEDGWREEMIRRIGDLVQTPRGLVGSPRTGSDLAPGGAWTKLADDVAARWTVSNRTLRKKRFTATSRGKLPAGYADCRATFDDDLGDDVVEECTQSLTWTSKVSARKSCPTGRGVFEYVARRRADGPYSWFCQTRRGVGNG